MGKVIVVGIGPGSYEDMTIRADRALRGCDAIVGYGVYVDLVKERYPDKAFYETPMTQEAKRCALALELARAGKTAAMVCSGDSGIYGMAALVYELRGESEEPEIEVVPGLTAACSAAALLGEEETATLPHIAYCSVGNADGTLPLLRCEAITVDEIKLGSRAVALAEHPLGDGGAYAGLWCEGCEKGEKHGELAQNAVA